MHKPRTCDTRELAQRAQARAGDGLPQQLWRDAVERRRAHAEDDAQTLHACGVVRLVVQAHEQRGNNAVDSGVGA